MFQNFGKVLRRCYVDVQIQSYLLYAVTIFGEDVETLFGLWPLWAWNYITVWDVRGFSGWLIGKNRRTKAEGAFPCGNFVEYLPLSEKEGVLPKPMPKPRMKSRPSLNGSSSARPNSNESGYSSSPRGLSYDVWHACIHTHTANDTQTFLDVCITPYVNLAQTTEDMYDLTHEHVHMGNWVYKCLHIFVQTLSSHKHMHRNIHANTQTRADADIVETTTVFHVAWPKREETEIVCQESYSFQSENAAGSQEKATIYAAILWLHTCTDFQADNVKDGEKWHLLKFL